ncbi:rhomboid family intramembrane serine protease [Aliiglaciecola litoralis]|uniref:Rhomboid family intramembrane serine protease GlpG n=1 Tax=Aliiglaciecola litoralis TaxID=582857 RepID=A0ABP3WX72_9ALTE
MTNQLELIAFNQQNAATALIVYLQSQNIAAQLVKRTKQQDFLVVLNDATDRDSAVAITKHFVAHPSDPKYQLAGSSIVAPLFGIQAFKQTPFTWFIVLLCAVVYVMQNAGLQVWVEQQFRILPLHVIAHYGQWWRVISPSLIHFSELHIILNLLVWWQIGRLIEFRLGSVSLITVFLLTSIISNIAQLQVSGTGFGGLSGVVYGVIGFAWFCGLLRPMLGIKLPGHFVAFAIAWLVLGYTDVLWIKLANTAHTGGLIAGGLAALCLVWFVKPKQR